MSTILTKTTNKTGVFSDSDRLTTGSLVRFGLRFSQFLFFILIAAGALAQSNPFRTKQTGDWNNSSTWEEDTGGGYAATLNTPDFNNASLVTILSGHTVTVTADVHVQSVVVNSGGAVIVNSSTTLFVEEDFSGVSFAVSAGAAITVNGTLDPSNLFISTVLVSGTMTNSGSVPTAVDENLTFDAGSTYIHLFTAGGTVPLAIWDAASVCEIQGLNVTATSPSNLNQSFGTFRWNTASLVGNISLTSYPSAIRGNLEIINTASKTVTMATATSVPAFSSLTIDGNLVNNAGNFVFTNALGAQSSITVKGDISITRTSTPSTVTLGVSNNNNITFNVEGNITLSGGGVLAKGSGTGVATLNFAKAGTQVFTNSSSTLSGSYVFVVNAGSTLNLGTSALTGSTSTFTLQTGAGLIVSEANGIATGTTTGNIRVGGLRSYASGSTITYAGNTQNLGSEWASAGALGVSSGVNLTIASGGTITNNNTTGTLSLGSLTLTSGTFVIATGANTISYSVTGFVATSGIMSGTSSASLTFTGSGTLSGNLSFSSGAENLKNLTISRSGTITLASTLNISGTLSFSGSGNLNFSGQTLAINGDIVQPGGGGLISTLNTSNLTIAGSGALTSFGFGGTMQLNNVQLSRSSGTYSWTSAGTVNGTLTLTDGSLTLGTNTLTMATGSTFSRIGGTTVVGSPTSTGTYSVSYSGVVATAGELPTAASGFLRDLTVSGVVSLNKSINVKGTLTINGGSLTAGANDVTISGTAFTVNSGSFTINSGQLVTFASGTTTTLSGASLSGIQFGNATVNPGTTLVVSGTNPDINVSGTWDNNGALTAGSSNFVFNGASQSIDTNGQPFWSVTFAGTGTKTLGQALDTHGSLTINNGVTLDVGVNRTITCGGSWVNNGTFNANNGLVVFDGTAQSINAAGQAFYDLQLSTSSTTKTLTGAIDINHNLTIDAGVTFDVSAIAYQINIAGNWINNGTFTRRTGTVVFDGTTVISGSTAPSFNNVTISGTALTLPSGLTTDVSGNWNQSAGTLTATGSTLQFSGSSQNIAPGGQSFNHVTISGAGTKTLTGAGTIAGVLTLSAGTFDASGQTLNLQGNFISNSASVLTTSTLTFSGTTVLSGSINPTFGSVTVSGTFSPASNFNINGNLVNNGTLNASAGTVTFGGSTAISGSNVCTFNNVTISNTLTAPAGNLNVAGVWTNNGTFTSNGGTVTFTGTNSIAGSSATNFNHIAIGATGTLTAPTTLNVAGNFTNNGSFNRGAGTVVFNGSGTQSISGTAVTDFNNITVSNNSNAPAVQVLTNQNLRGVLTLSGTNTVFDADGAGSAIFKIMSTGDSPTSDGGIATLPSGTSVTGQVTVQRYMSLEGTNNRIFRYISSPVQSAPVSQLQAFIPVTGTFTGSSACSGCTTNASMTYYNESVTTDTNGSGIADLNDGYVNYPVAANSETFVTGVGYKVFIRGNVAPLSTAGTALWELRGTVNSGNISLPVSFTSSGTLANDGWNLVGNPYPSTIDWNAAGWTKSNVNNSTYILDNGLATPVFATYNGSVGTNGGSRYIAAGQAFWVKSDGPGSPTLSVTEAVKVAGTQTTFFREALPENILRVTLKQGAVADEIVLQFTDQSSVAFDSQLDAKKLQNPTTFNLASLSSDNVKLAINAMPMSQDCFSSIKLDVSNVPAGSYSLNFSDFETFTNNLTRLVLVDAFTGQQIDIRQSVSYAFQVTANAASFGSERFSIKVGEALATVTATGSSRCDAGTLTLNASGAADGNYRWFTDAAGTQVISGATASTLVTGTLTKTTSYYVAAANSAGCFGARTEVIATVVGDVPSTLSASNASRCGAGSVTLNASGASSADGYRWYTSYTGGTAIAGATGAAFVTPSLSQKTTYYVTTLSAGGCEQLRIPVVAEVAVLTPVEITVNGQLLQSSYAQGNQWYKDGQIIPGATGATYQPETSGVYSVTVNSGGCTTSVDKQFVITGLGEGLPTHIVVSPIPTSSVVNVAVETDQIVGAQILSLSGARLYEQTLTGGSVKRGSFNLQDQADGMYILVVEEGNQVYKIRIIKK